MIRQGIKEQLGYVRRDLGFIDSLIKAVPCALTEAQNRQLQILRKVYEQQYSMWKERSTRCDNRIVSISQPQVRPIVRGKAGAHTEFGAKVALSMTKGYVRVDHINFDSFNEGALLISQIEDYKKQYGVYPAVVQCDAIYRTKMNRQFCKEKGIRMSGPALGRRPKETVHNNKIGKQMRKDEAERVEIEGCIGTLKRRYTWNRVYARLATTTVTWIWIAAIVYNLKKASKAFLFFLKILQSRLEKLHFPTYEFAKN
jgi:hypothetical protein